MVAMAYHQVGDNDAVKDESQPSEKLPFEITFTENGEAKTWAISGRWRPRGMMERGGKLIYDREVYANKVVNINVFGADEHPVKINGILRGSQETTDDAGAFVTPEEMERTIGVVRDLGLPVKIRIGSYERTVLLADSKFRWKHSRHIEYELTFEIIQDEFALEFDDEQDITIEPYSPYTLPIISGLDGLTDIIGDIQTLVGDINEFIDGIYDDLSKILSIVEKGYNLLYRMSQTIRSVKSNISRFQSRVDSIRARIRTWAEETDRVLTDSGFYNSLSSVRQAAFDERLSRSDELQQQMDLQLLLVMSHIKAMNRLYGSKVYNYGFRLYQKRGGRAGEWITINENHSLSRLAAGANISFLQIINDPANKRLAIDPGKFPTSYLDERLFIPLQSKGQ